MKVLIIGPSHVKSKGGMATVINGILDDDELNKKFSINSFSSYIDGNIVIRLMYSIVAYIKFLFIYKKYDIFHIHMASYGSTFRKAFYVRKIKKNKKKVIIHIHGASYLEFFESLNKRRQKYVIDTIKGSDMVIALSDKWKVEFEKIFNIRNIKVLNNGIDVHSFKNSICDIDANKNNFIFMGRIGERKGVYDLVKAIENLKCKYKDIKCYVAGDGEVEKLKRIVSMKSLEDNIEIVGWVDFNKKKELLSKVCTIILPSYNEGLPMALLEGMSAGKAVISTDVGGIPELVVHNENGFIIKPGDINRLEESISILISSSKVIKRFSNNNIKKINQNFNRKKIHKKLSQYYYEVIKV